MQFNLSAYIDHTLLKPTTTISDIDKLCVEASLEGFAAVCIPPRFVQDAKKMLDGTAIKVATVIGFPLGYNTIDVKVKEIEEAIKMGADELDMVINLSALKAGDWQYLENEIASCIKPIRAAGRIIKVIVESGLLTENELVGCCELYGKYRIDYLKTSTGYAENGVTVRAIELIRKHLPKGIGIKASGGIRTYDFAMELVNAGATRLGCSASMQIMKESREKKI